VTQIRISIWDGYYYSFLKAKYFFIILYGKCFYTHLYRNVYPMNATNTYSSDFLDILFDGRNKDYGAYDLRRSQDRRVRNAIIGTASIALVIIGGYALSNRLVAADMHTRMDVVAPIVITDIHPVVEKPPVVTPPPPVRPASAPPAVSSVTYTPPVITREEVRPEDEAPKIADIGNKSVSTTTTSGDDVNGVDVSLLAGGTGVPGGNLVEGPKGEDRETVRTFVEKMPSFPGGNDALAKFLSKNIRYPHMASDNGIEGRVFIQFVVDYEGNIKDVKAVGAIRGGGLEEEAVRLVKLMPKWTPGRQNGQAVSVQFNLPVSFQLGKE
jgi:protein TonB